MDELQGLGAAADSEQMFWSISCAETRRMTPV